jgi:hypothetical protein
MPMVDLEYELEKRYVVGLRAIFKNEIEFLYNSDITKTNVVISSEYPDIKDGAEFKTPHLVVGGIGLQWNNHTSFGSNYLKPVMQNGVKIGEQFVNIIPYSLTILAIGVQSDSKNLGLKAFNFISFGASEVFEQMGLNIQTIAKSSTTPQKQYPETIFETPLMVSGYFEWKGTKSTELAALHILKDIKLQLETY